jgi:hydroxymethylglutaryl-CoA lyase
MTQTDRAVRIVEVGPRDGLQNEEAVVPAGAKVAFIEALAATGLQVVEATSFVSPRAIPQLADADEVFPRIRRRSGVRYPVLVPNLRGLERAEAAGVDAVAVFTAASEAFTQHNIGMSIEESLAAFAPVLERAAGAGWWRRGYVSTAFGCPYSGDVATEAAVEVAVALMDLGCDEISIGDTIGVAHPDDVRRVVGALLARIPADRLALHLHDTYGRALENVEAGLELGIRVFDASAGGTGGCPYASLVGLLDRLGYEHGVDGDGVARAAAEVRASFVPVS